MSEELKIDASLSKEEMYKELVPQIKSMIEHEPDLIANLANVSAALKQTFGHLWVGFYLLRQDELVLGPFQGPIACTRIGYGRGVCGTAWEKKKTVIVPDVDKFPGHIACSSASRSEIVVPIFFEDRFAGVLDIDSSEPDTFDEIDRKYLEEMCSFIMW